jgi:hypothetical protein
MPAAAKAPHAVCAIRAATLDDLPFVASTWKQAWWRDSQWTRTRWPVFDAGYSRVIARLLRQSSVLVATSLDDTTELMGALVYEMPEADSLVSTDALPPALQWTYVKAPFRQCGVFRTMLAASGLPDDFEVVHATGLWLGHEAMGTRPARPGVGAHYPHHKHNPWRAFPAESD